MPGHFTFLDGAVLLGYFLLTMGIGLYFWRKSRTTEGYMAAGRSVPGWAAGLSIFGTYLSSITFLGLPGKAFASNWNAFVFSLSIPLAAWVAVKWFVPYYRGSGEISGYAQLEHRFGPWARIYASVCFLLTQIARMGTVMFLMAVPMSVLLGWNIRTIIIITGISTTLYSFVGGIVAVIWTDVIQSLVLIVGALLCATIMLVDLGAGDLVRIGAQSHKFSLGSFGSSLSEPTFWVMIAYGLFINLQNFGIDQNYIQRYLVSKNDREARKSVWLGALLYVPVSAVFFFIGTALFAYYQVHAGQLPELYATKKPDFVFAHFIVTVLPPGVTGLLIAAVFAAAMSTISSCLNAFATLLFSDYYKRYLRPDVSERESMLVLHSGTILAGILGTGTAVAMSLVSGSNALDIWWELAGILGGGMLGLFLLGFISRRAGNPAAITATIIGVLVIVWMTFSTTDLWPHSLAQLRSPFHNLLVTVIGTLSILLVGLLLSRAGRSQRTPRGDRDRAEAYSA